MPATTVHAGLALVVAAALLADAYDRRALALVLVIVVLPDLDAIPGLAFPGAHRAMFHTLVLPIAATVLLYYDVRVRERSWLRDRWDDRGVRLAGVAIVVHLCAHLFLDWAHLDGINLLYPAADQFYRLEGELVLSSTEGLVQTFVDVGDAGVDAGRTGTTADVHVSTPAEPERGRGLDREVERIVPIAVGGWQLYLLLLGPFVLAARKLQRGPPSE